MFYQMESMKVNHWTFFTSRSKWNSFIIQEAEYNGPVYSAHIHKADEMYLVRKKNPKIKTLSNNVHVCNCTYTSINFYYFLISLNIQFEVRQ